VSYYALKDEEEVSKGTSNIIHKPFVLNKGSLKTRNRS